MNQINELKYLVQQVPQIGANAPNTSNVVKFNSQLAKEKVIATNEIIKILLKNFSFLSGKMFIDRMNQ